MANEFDRIEVFFMERNLATEETTMNGYLKRKQYLQQRRNAQPIKMVRHEVSGVAIAFDGTNYIAEIKRSGMKGDGFLSWQDICRKRINYAKSICYSKHIAKFGFLNQTAPVFLDEVLLDEEGNFIGNEPEDDAPDAAQRLQTLVSFDEVADSSNLFPIDKELENVRIVEIPKEQLDKAGDFLFGSF